MATLKIRDGQFAGHIVEMSADELVIGRDSGCDVVIEMETISRRHARIFREGDEFFVEDLGSTNGTFLNGALITGRAPIKDNDLIKVNRVGLSFHHDPSDHGHSHLDIHVDTQEATRRPNILAKVDPRRAGDHRSADPELKLQTIVEIINNLTSTVDRQETLEGIVQGGRKVFPQADRVYVLLKDSTDKDLRLAAIWQRSEQSEESPTARAISRSIARAAMNERQALLSVDALSDEKIEQSQSIFDCQIHSVMCAPLFDTEGEPLGAIHVDSQRPGELFKPADLEVLVSVATVAGFVVERSRAHESRLEQARLAAIGQTVAGVVHESRNIMNAMQLSLELLDRQFKGDQQAQSVVERLRKGQLDLLRLFEEIRGYAAPLVIKTEPCDLRQIWRDTWAEVAALHADCETDFEEFGQLGEINAVADPFRLRQLFHNLFENALSAAPEQARIEIAVDRTVLGSRPAWKIVVRDHGPGFPEEHLSRLFEAFFTTKRKGTGLGLAICRRVVEAHQGEIQAENHADGAQFVILLPMRPAEEPE